MKTLLYSSFFITFSLWCLPSCDWLGSNINRQYSLISPGHQINHIPHEDFFYINLVSAHYVGDREGFNPLDFVFYALDDGIGTDCKIQFTEDNQSTEDLHCRLEIMEGDLWMHDMTIEYNIPPGMCHYLSFDTHWHYNQKTGQGPKYVVQVPSAGNVDKDGVPETRYKGCLDGIEDKAGCKNSSCRDQSSCLDKTDSCNACPSTEEDCKPEASEWIEYKDCTGHPKNDIVGPKENAGDACPYIDSESGNESNINCCLGKYNLYEYKELTPKETDVDWGGDIKNCIGGLGRISWDEYDKKGFPAGSLSSSLADGMLSKYELPALIKKVEYTEKSKTRAKMVSYPTANFYENISVTNRPFKFYKQDNDPVARQGYPFITWACLDESYEVRHQIHLTIREWNTTEEFIKFKEGGNGNPDIGGTEDDGCDYYAGTENNPVFGDCNDLEDVKDLNPNEYPGIDYK